jgi:uncharacterized membrane protein YadS
LLFLVVIPEGNLRLPLPLLLLFSCHPSRSGGSAVAFVLPVILSEEKDPAFAFAFDLLEAVRICGHPWS